VLRLLLLPLVLIGSFIAPSALAQDSVEVARRHFEAGTAAFDTGDYATAVREFRASYELTHHPDILFNIYSAAERGGSVEEAVTALEHYLAEGTIEPERRPALEQRLARLRERVAEPEPDPVVEPDPIVEPEPAPAPSGGAHPAGVALLVGAGVAGLLFGGLAIGSALEADRLANECGADRTCTDEQVSTLAALNTAADVTWPIAAAAGIAGLVLIFVLPPEQSAHTRVVPVIGPNVAGLVIAGRM
jgi:hypothetical protein